MELGQDVGNVREQFGKGNDALNDLSEVWRLCGTSQCIPGCRRAQVEGQVHGGVTKG